MQQKQKENMLFEKLFFAKHLEKGEEILYAVHRHSVLLIKPALGVGFFGFLIPWSLYSIGFNTRAFLIIAIVWSVLAYKLFMLELFEWHANSVLITSMGVIHVRWTGFFSNLASRVAYEDLEGAAYEIKGFWSTVLRYGTFTVRMRSGNNFVLPMAAKPAKAEMKLMEFQEKYLNDKNKKDVVGLKSLLSDLASHHLRVKN
ncbi:MAG: hypothetical protein V1908_01860 [Candidatus Peregrinibacteria bacterium]